MRGCRSDGIDGDVTQDYHARFAASGKYLIFLPGTRTGTSRRRCSENKRPDGSDVRQLTPWRLAADEPDLSLAGRT